MNIIGQHFQGDFKQALFSNMTSGHVPGILTEEEGDVTVPDIQFQEGELDQLDEDFDRSVMENLIRNPGLNSQSYLFVLHFHIFSFMLHSV